MGEKVTSVFEHAIKVLSRKDDILDNRQVYESTPAHEFSLHINLSVM